MPLGCVLAYYDLNDSKAEFSTFRPKVCILPATEHIQEILTFPQLPIAQVTQNFIPPTGYLMTHPILQAVTVTNDKAFEIEKHTVGQADDARWFTEKQYRLTASNFGRVLFRQQQPS